MYSDSGLPMIQIILCFVAFILHIIAITSSYWTNFYAKNEFGVPFESGHLGLWLVCYNDPHSPFRYDRYGREFCDFIDTMYRPPPFISLASVLAVIAAIVLLLYFPFAIIRHKQLNSSNSKNNSISRFSGAFKLAIATLATILIVLVLIFISLREHELGTREFIPVMNFRGFWVTKNWAFYLETIVSLITLVLALLSLMENNRTTNIDQNNLKFSSSYPQDEQIRIGQTNTLPRRSRNEYVDSPRPNNLRLPHSSSQNSLSGQADGHVQSAYSDRSNYNNTDMEEDIDQIDEGITLKTPLEDSITKLNKHIKKSPRFPISPPNTAKSFTTPNIKPLTTSTVQINQYPFTYIPNIKPPKLSRNLSSKSSNDLRSEKLKKIEKRRSSLERTSPIILQPYNSSAFIDDEKNLNSLINYDLNSNTEPFLKNSPISKTDQFFNINENPNQPQRFRTRIISTSTTTTESTSTLLKKPQTFNTENYIKETKNNDDNKNSGITRFYNIDVNQNK